MLATVTKLPASPARFNLSFDKFRNIDPQFAVNVRPMRGGRFKSTGIAWEDFQRMNIRHSSVDTRAKQTPMPPWARNDELLRDLVVHFMENRVGLLPDAGLTPRQRLDHAQRELETRRPHFDALLTKLCREFVEQKNAGGNRKQLRRLAIQIENVDTQLMLLDRTASVLISIVYLYWRANMDSVGVAETLGIKPPHVRIILCRLGSLWENLQDPNWVPRHIRTFESKIASEYARDIVPGKVFGKLTVLGPHVDVIPVDVICTADPRSLVSYGPYGRKQEQWVENKYLTATGFRKATMRCEPVFESWDCQCTCGKQTVVTTGKLRSGTTSCGCK